MAPVTQARRHRATRLGLAAAVLSNVVRNPSFTRHHLCRMTAQADWMCLLCNTADGRPPHGNKTMIVLPMDTPGVSVSPRFDKLGMRASDTCQVKPQQQQLGMRAGDTCRVENPQQQVRTTRPHEPQTHTVFCCVAHSHMPRPQRNQAHTRTHAMATPTRGR